MRKEIPLIICFLAGFVMILTFFSGNEDIKNLSTDLLNWSMIIGGAAFFLAVGSLFQVNLQKISRKSDGWGFSVILLASFFITLFLGLGYGVDATYEKEINLSNGDLLANFQNGVDAYKINTAKGITILRNILMVSDEKEIERIVGSVIKSGVPNNQIVIVKHYNPFFFIYKYVYAAMAGTMFSLLAFFVASAAYRAFKARSIDSGLLLAAAFLVMIGRVSIGEAIWPGFSTIAEWIMNVPQTAGQRAIQIGAALGLVSSSARILLGLEQSYLGQD
jgi:hypothetical protein